ncbi:Protein kinase-like protein [Penicillium verhagenii]|uniref:Protein kinase-like protein n=1 Tax=Penicillium verhagenii TaxID=1562060 RepID=UPI0025451753|nr:Protein kinase-like protein [Penicillium verhagenii]KAJ5921483.1 Protein kinase-like protein [Penicillium verhagenii]
MHPLSQFLLGEFFEEHSPITRNICDEIATTISGGRSISPAPLQGGQSYTVKVGDGMDLSVIQFRGPDNILDLELLESAQKTYGQFVPICEYLAEQYPEKVDPLKIYKMNYIPGDVLLQVNAFLHQPENFALLKMTVQDFARFCSYAWNNRPSMPQVNKASIQNKYLCTLDRMIKVLPSHFEPVISELKTRIPSLFADDYPMVINHWDLLENNIHVDTKTGNLTGISDWKDAEPGPFAMQLWGLENILGIRKMTGMAFHPQHIQLRQLFWKTLYQEIGDVSEETKLAIQTARMAGIFISNEFTKASEEQKKMYVAILESMTLDLCDIGLGTGN